MNAHIGRVLADQALVGSDQAAPRLDPTGFDPSRYEAFRPALIAYHEVESPWMGATLEALRKGWAMNDDNRRTIRALAAAVEALSC